MTGMKATEKRPILSSVSCARTDERAKEFLVKYNPDFQMQICGDEQHCIMGKFPTLAELKRDFGSSIPACWLVPQLQDLSWYCGVRDKLNARQMEECAYVIATEFFFLKVSELMLFFHRFKSGRYGRFFGSIDPLVITKALREFVAERNNALDRYEGEARRQRLEEERKHAVTWEQYCTMTGQQERINHNILQPS